MTSKAIVHHRAITLGASRFVDFSRRSRGLTWLCLTVVIAMSSSAYAAEFTCPAEDVRCLVDAITAANANGETNALTLSPGIYTFTAPAQGTNGLPSANGLPLVTGILTIRGVKGATILEREPTAPPFRLLRVEAAGRLLLDGLVIQGFWSQNNGGAVHNQGTVTIVDSTITSNRAFSMYADSVTYGGGIWNSGTLIIQHSSVTHNRNAVNKIAAGGGIYNSGTLRVEDSAITDNLNASGPGGGIYNAGSLVIVNSTVARNTCYDTYPFALVCGDYGAIVPGPSLVLRNSTVVNNSGGVVNRTNGIVSIQNSILAHNDVGRWHPDCSGVITSLDHNLIRDLTGCIIVLGTDDRIADPLLGEFSDEGTPGSSHFPLMSGSPAIDAGNDEACPLTDQLGQPRVGRCDIGAIEFQPLGPNSCLGKGTGRLRGRVFDATSRSAISDVTLTLSGPDGCADAASTGASGRSVFRTLGGGTYTVTPFKQSCTFVPMTRTVTTVDDAGTARFRATCVEPDE